MKHVLAQVARTGESRNEHLVKFAFRDVSRACIAIAQILHQPGDKGGLDTLTLLKVPAKFRITVFVMRQLLKALVYRDVE